MSWLFRFPSNSVHSLGKQRRKGHILGLLHLHTQRKTRNFFWASPVGARAQGPRPFLCCFARPKAQSWSRRWSSWVIFPYGILALASCATRFGSLIVNIKATRSPIAFTFSEVNGYSCVTSHMPANANTQIEPNIYNSINIVVGLHKNGKNEGIFIYHASGQGLA